MWFTSVTAQPCSSRYVNSSLMEGSTVCYVGTSCHSILAMSTPQCRRQLPMIMELNENFRKFYFDNKSC